MNKYDFDERIEWVASKGCLAGLRTILTLGGLVLGFFLSVLLLMPICIVMASYETSPPDCVAISIIAVLVLWGGIFGFRFACTDQRISIEKIEEERKSFLREIKK